MGETYIMKAKHHDKPFYQADRAHTQRSDLSWKATGLYAFFCSLPGDWKINYKHLCKAKIDGVWALRSGMKELLDKGFLHTTTQRDSSGRFYRTTTFYEFTEQNPHFKKAGEAEGESGAPHAVS